MQIGAVEQKRTEEGEKKRVKISFLSAMVVLQLYKQYETRFVKTDCNFVAK